MAQGPTISSPWSAWRNATALLLASFVAVAALTLQPRPDSEVVAVAFPPWWSTQRTIIAVSSTDAALVRTTAVPSLLIVKPATGGHARLRKAGAWLVIDPQAIAACLTL